MSKVILASASPRRRELLKKAGIVFEVRPGDGEEIVTKTNPWEVVQELSLQKAMQAASGLKKTTPDTVILGADTVVAFQGMILGKPKDEEDACRTLEKLQGNTHQVYTGVTILFQKEHELVSHTFFECTHVTFAPVSREEIEAYVLTKEPMDKAGSYGIQGAFGKYVAFVQGDYENVVGLPVTRLMKEAKNLGLELEMEM